MNIKNLTSGYSYVLSPDTKLKVERTNPFFNEYGEQTLPVSIPDTPQNRKAMNYPSILAGVKKHDQMQEVSIQDGEYYMVCRQALLGSKSGDKISTSFYMNEGSFFSKLKNTYITDVFKGETVPGVETLDQAINYLKDINEAGGNEMFSIFQVRLKDDDNKKKRWINGHEHTTKVNGPIFDNEEETTEVIDGNTIIVSRGFYMSPFLKVNYVLKRLFQHFGYTMLDNFFTQTKQFQNMVFINNVADAIVTGVIHLDQLIPAVSCAKILDLLRKKFCCEFIPDETTHTVKVIFLKDIIQSAAVSDYSGQLVDSVKVDFPESYRQISIEPEDKLDDSAGEDSLAILKSKFPTAQFGLDLGCFTREGYAVAQYDENADISILPPPRFYKVVQVVGETCQRYYEGGNNTAEPVKVPECFPSSAMYIGEEQFLNSSMNVGRTDSDNNASAAEKNDKRDDTKMHLMLAFAFKDSLWKCITGTVTNYASQNEKSDDFYRIGDYSLVYNGYAGIFEKFYRPYDTLLRNSLHTVKAKLLLTQHQKLSASSYQKVTIEGNEYLPNSFNYVLGGKDEPVESTFFTTKLYKPVDEAKNAIEMFPPLYDEYVWKMCSSYKNITPEEYEASDFKGVNIPTFYPDAPSAKYLNKKMYECHTARPMYGHHALFSFWLEVEPAPAK